MKPNLKTDHGGTMCLLRTKKVEKKIKPKSQQLIWSELKNFTLIHGLFENSLLWSRTSQDFVVNELRIMIHVLINLIVVLLVSYFQWRIIYSAEPSQGEEVPSSIRKYTRSKATILLPSSSASLPSVPSARTSCGEKLRMLSLIL